jgi:hypothetical protein
MDKGGFGYLVQRPEDHSRQLKTKNMDWITDQIAIGDALDAVNHAPEFDSLFKDLVLDDDKHSPLLFINPD